MIHRTRWTPQKIARRLQLIAPLAQRRQVPLPPFRFRPLPGPEAAPPVGSDIADEDWPEIAPHTYWGRWQQDFVLRTTFGVPPEWPARKPIALWLPLGEAGDFSHPEALVYLDGAPLAGSDRHHQLVRLPDSCRDGQVHRLALHGWTGLGRSLRGETATQLFMRPCAVVQVDTPTRDFVAAARVALGIADNLDNADPARGLLYNALDAAFKALDTREPLTDAFYDSVPAAHEVLRAGAAAAGPPLAVDLIAAGHAHIDVAWLWTLAQTRRKAGRTFHTVLHLMDEFPDYHFTQSQPQLYEYVRQDYPQLLAGIKERVTAGRWEPIGGMWVEADCNLSGAEALARQFLLGRAYFRELFGPGAESPVLWLPDVFGYAWNLPQLIKEAGLEYFFTIKISWNQYNRLPYDSFWWQGLDGTRVLTHFSTTQDDGAADRPDPSPSTYNAAATPSQALSTWRNLQQKADQQVLLMSYGYGDGGGGPTREMLENIREMAAMPATPQMRPGKAIEFFRRLEAESGDRLPTWNGELYLEYHRGTYTTQAKNKRNNRKSEFLLHDAEFLAAWAAQAADYAYPHQELTRAWRLLCLHQFHDILPGSSIGPVYADSDRDYAQIRAIGDTVIAAALAALARRLPEETFALAVNPTSFGGQHFGLYRLYGLLPAALPAGQALVDLTQGETVETQAVAGGTLVLLPLIAAYGQVALGLAPAPGPARARDRFLNGTPFVQARQEGDNVSLENHMLSATFNQAGDLVRLYDRPAQRQILPAGAAANVFQAFEDRPLDWDAWDIDSFYDDKMWLAEPAHHLEIIEEGPLRAGLEIRRRLFSSEIRQRIYLYRDGSRLDFVTEIDWRERHILLKVAFPVDILSPTATYDVQWGNVQRPTQRNTSWDWARFETCAHKWVDLSEGNYGVSLLNDCKYGHDIRDNVIRLTLLRSPTHPDPEADQGRHTFTYSLLPHRGDWREGTVAAAYALNDPLRIVPLTGRGEGALAPALVQQVGWRQSTVIETVKQAEDGQGLIVRLYENERTRGTATLQTGFPLAGAWRCNLLEEKIAELAVGGAGDLVEVPVRPYEILTLRLVPS